MYAKLIVLIFSLSILSCTPSVKCVVVEDLAVSEGKKHVYHVVSLDGNYVEIVKLDSTYKAGDLVRIKIREQ